jgi:peptidyl-dipeptidase Dcp
MVILLAAASLHGSSSVASQKTNGQFGPDNPFYAPSPLPFQAPPFDKIKDGDYQPAIEAGMAQQREEVRAIADNSAAPTFENTFVALEKSGQLFNRVMNVFNGVTNANLNPLLDKVQQEEAPKLAAHQDSIFLDPKLFRRVEAVYEQRESLKLDPESLRLVRSEPFRCRQGRTQEIERRGVNAFNRVHHQTPGCNQGRGFRDCR